MRQLITEKKSNINPKIILWCKYVRVGAWPNIQYQATEKFMTTINVYDTEGFCCC